MWPISYIVSTLINKILGFVTIEKKNELVIFVKK